MRRRPNPPVAVNSNDGEGTATAIVTPSDGANSDTILPLTSSSVVPSSSSSQPTIRPGAVTRKYNGKNGNSSSNSSSSSNSNNNHKGHPPSNSSMTVMGGLRRKRGGSGAFGKYRYSSSSSNSAGAVSNLGNAILILMSGFMICVGLFLFLGVILSFLYSLLTEEGKMAVHKRVKRLRDRLPLGNTIDYVKSVNGLDAFLNPNADASVLADDPYAALLPHAARPALVSSPETGLDVPSYVVILSVSNGQRDGGEMMDDHDDDQDDPHDDQRNLKGKKRRRRRKKKRGGHDDANVNRPNAIGRLAEAARELATGRRRHDPNRHHMGLYVAVGISTESPAVALRQAQKQLPRRTNKFPFVKIDVLTELRTYHEVNYYDKLKFMNRWKFFGLAFDWGDGGRSSRNNPRRTTNGDKKEDASAADADADADAVPANDIGASVDDAAQQNRRRHRRAAWNDDIWVFGESEVMANGMVDMGHTLRLEHIADYATKRRHLTGWAIPTLSDDEPELAVMDAFVSNSVFLDLSLPMNHPQRIVPLYHTHRMFPKHEASSPSALLNAAKDGGVHLASIVKSNHPLGSGRQVYNYNPRSDDEPDGYNLTRHAGTLWAMACIYKYFKMDAEAHANANRNGNANRNDDDDDAAQIASRLLSSMDLTMEYLKRTFEDCPLPYDQNAPYQKCVVDLVYDDDHPETKPKKMVKLGVNALSVLAMAEYMDATGKRDEELLRLSKSIAAWMAGCQREDGSFVQRVWLDGDHNEKVELDLKYFVRYYQGEVTFALSRLFNVVRGSVIDETPDQRWIDVAYRAASFIVAADKQKKDEEFDIDHWLMYGFREMRFHRMEEDFVDHAMRTARVASSVQTLETPLQKDKNGRRLDHLGVYYYDYSGCATATKSEGLCAAHPLAVEYGRADDAKLIEETVELSLRYELQTQYRPERAMFMKDPPRIMGGFHDSIYRTEMRNDFTQHNIGALLCWKDVLEKKAVDADVKEALEEHQKQKQRKLLQQKPPPPPQQ